MAATTEAEFNEANLEKLYNAIAEEEGVALGKVIQPSRLALSGRTVWNVWIRPLPLRKKCEGLTRLIRIGILRINQRLLNRYFMNQNCKMSCSIVQTLQ